MSRYQVDTVIDFDKTGSRQYKETESISQRESLKTMVLKKYLDQYSSKFPQISKDIYQEVNYFFYNETVNEAGIRILKQRIQNLAQIHNSQLQQSKKMKKLNGNMSLQNLLGQEANKSSLALNSNNKEKSEIILPAVRGSQREGSVSRNSLYQVFPKFDQTRKQSDTSSVSSFNSMRAKSVYYLEGRDEDEWAKLVQFDAEMFKKEQQMLKMRNQKTKENLKAELDRQMREKEEKKFKEKQENEAYEKFQEKLSLIQDEADKIKREDKQKRILIEKTMIEQQKQNRKLKKKQEQQQEKQLEDAIITSIISDQQAEQEDRLRRKEDEKKRQQQMMIESQIIKSKIESEIIRDKNEDIALQNLYSKMLQEQDEKREKEKRDRYQKLLDSTKLFESTAQANQKEQLRIEDQKMLSHILETNKREEAEDEVKRKKMEEQKVKIRTFLDSQVQQKLQKKYEEDQLNKKQADIWEKDKDDFLNHEKSKSSYILMANRAHQKVLSDQIKEKELLQIKGKMTLDELKQNKNRIQEIINTQPENAAQYKHSKETEVGRYN